MCEFYNERLICKPRKIHYCEGCCKPLRLDRKHYNISGKFEGDFFNVRLCFACRKHLNNYGGDYEDGYIAGDLLEGRREYVRQWQESRKLKRERKERDSNAN